MLARTFGERPPLGDHIRIVAERQRQVDVLLDQQHGDAGGFQHLQAGDELLHHDRRQPERQLVDHQNLGPRHQPARDRQHLLLAARQRSGLLRATLFEAREHHIDFGQLRGEPLLGAGRTGAHLEILLDAHVAEHLAASARDPVEFAVAAAPQRYDADKRAREGRTRTRTALDSRASVSGSDGGLAEPAKPPVHADQNLIDALVHILDEELAIGEDECFVPVPQTHMVPLQPH